MLKKMALKEINWDFILAKKAKNGPRLMNDWYGPRRRNNVSKYKNINLITALDTG